MAVSLTAFKSRLKSHLFYLAYNDWPAPPPPLELRSYGGIEINVLLHFTRVIGDDNVYWSCTSVCLYLCLSVAACPRYCTDPDVTWGNGRGCPLVVQLGGFAMVHGLCCYGNIAWTRNVIECLYSLYAQLLLWTDRDAVWDVDLGGPKELCIRWGLDLAWREEALFSWVMLGFYSTLPSIIPSGHGMRISHMLLISIPIGQLKKQLSVTWNFSNENFPCDAASHQNCLTTCSYLQCVSVCVCVCVQVKWEAGEDGSGKPRLMSS